MCICYKNRHVLPLNGVDKEQGLGLNKKAAKDFHGSDVY